MLALVAGSLIFMVFPGSCRRDGKRSYRQRYLSPGFKHRRLWLAVSDNPNLTGVLSYIRTVFLPLYQKKEWQIWGKIYLIISSKALLLWREKVGELTRDNYGCWATAICIFHNIGWVIAAGSGFNIRYRHHCLLNAWSHYLCSWHFL